MRTKVAYARKVTPHHIRQVLMALREEDYKEMCILHGHHTRREAVDRIENALYQNPTSDTRGMFTEYGPYALFGTVADSEEATKAAIWFLSTPAVDLFHRSTLLLAEDMLPILAKPYPDGVSNIIWAGNEKHLAWCIALGFRLKGRHEINGETFHEVHWSPS